ncbi:MAG: hypothetical protein VKJ64_17225 [Leptolyngbyaceae bacterium]|nr:hypothetical protein [Leptolyngbyaceae bacterium]
MKQEVIKDFLNLPGIEGLALVDGRSRPFFCGVDQGLNFQQKQALAQGIQQVIETTPVSYQFFQFQFSGRQVYVHKLPKNLILLVLASNELAYQTYHQTLNLLKVELHQDGGNAIANFQLIAGQTAISSIRQQNSQPSNPTHNPNPVLTPQPRVSPPKPPSVAVSSPPPNPNSSPVPVAAATPPTSNGKVAPAPAPPAPAPPAQTPPPTTATPATDVSIDEFLTAINALLHVSTDYLGKTMVINYWKSSRPPLEWLSNFDINASGHFVVADTAKMEKNKPLNQEQQQWLREWVKAFIQRCARIIRDFPKLLVHGELDKHQKKLLFTQT